MVTKRSRSRAQARAFLIDGNAFCYRAFYAIRELRTSTGRPTNAIYGFITMLQALLEKERPDYMAVAFDVPKPTFRHERFAPYKEHRRPMPEALIEQLPTIREYVQATRMRLYECPGYEADDVLATIARAIAGPALEVYIVTGDKDALQLVSAHIKVYAPKPHERIFDAPAVKERFGVPPEQMTDLMALMGDATDNIPSVPGVGEKTARALIEKFGSVDHLLAQLDHVDSPALQRTLRAHVEQVRMAHELATVDAAVPIEIALDELKRRSPDTDALRALYRALEFKGLLRKLGPAPQCEVSTATPMTVLGETSDGSFEQACRADTVACVAVTQPTDAHGTTLTGCMLVWEGGAVHCPVPTAESWQRFAPFWQGARSQIIVHDWKPLKRALLARHITCHARVFDTQIAAYVLHPGQPRPSLEDLAMQYLRRTISWESMDGAALMGPTQQQAAVVAGDVLLALRPQLEAALDAKALRPLYETVEQPLADILAAMEAQGIRLDTQALRALSTALTRELDGIHRALVDAVGHEVNLNSPKQLAHVLYDELKLPVLKRTKTGPSTDADTLSKLAQQHPLPAQLMTYRELTKLQSTYVDTLPQLVDATTGRLHTTLHQTVTATGRLSSSDPNLQNIPVRSEMGRKIRRAFLPRRRGWVLLSADYSQIELRILAHLSGDAALRRAFQEHRDVHRYTASLIYGATEQEITHAMRAVAKTVNFGVIYGMEAHGLARELRIPLDEAQAFIDAYFERYPGVAAYAHQQVQQARQQGYVTTILGRRRYLPELQSPQGSVRQFGERVAVNAPIQGSAADLIKLAMIHIDRALHATASEAQMVLQVHDDLLFDVPQRAVPTLAQMVEREMVRAMQLEVPLVVTLKVGPNWADLEALPRP